MTAHTLTGTLTTFREEGLGGEHKECFLASVRSAVAAIQELLQAREQLWVCAGCRFSTDHQAMSSTIKSCSTCGESQEWTLHSYCSAWLRGLLTKGLQSYDRERDLIMTNYAQLGERLLAPHRKQVGLEYPGHRELGGKATCACEVEAIPSVIGLEGGNTIQGNNQENMGTLESGVLSQRSQVKVDCWELVSFTFSLIASSLIGSSSRCSTNSTFTGTE